MKAFDPAGKANVGAKTKSRGRWAIFACLWLTAIGFGTGGCVATYPGGYGTAYVPAGISVEIGDRPYYTRGRGYYVGRSYYAWRPGHWRRHRGHRAWVHGRYYVR